VPARGYEETVRRPYRVNLIFDLNGSCESLVTYLSTSVSLTRGSSSPWRLLETSASPETFSLSGLAPKADDEHKATDSDLKDHGS